MRRVRVNRLTAVLLLAPALALAANSGKRARIAEEFRNADADGNGTLSREEAARAAPWLAQRFDAIDANHDGRISPEEIRAHRRAGRSEGAGRRGRAGGGEQQGAKFAQYFARADTDGDGVLSGAEAERGLPRVAKNFGRIDSDGDGRLTLEEVRAWLDARRAARSSR